MKCITPSNVQPVSASFGVVVPNKNQSEGGSNWRCSGGNHRRMGQCFNVLAFGALQSGNI